MQRCDFCRNYMKQQTWRKEEGCYLSSTTLHTGKCRHYKMRDDTVEDIRDSAKFEAMVAAWLAHHHNCLVACPSDQCMRSCDDHVLKIARLAVEKEMDG